MCRVAESGVESGVRWRFVTSIVSSMHASVFIAPAPRLADQATAAAPSPLAAAIAVALGGRSAGEDARAMAGGSMVDVPGVKPGVPRPRERGHQVVL